MHISGFQLRNYKSFLSPERLNFTPGFNVIVGQNNSGKTALVEALSLNFSDHPHRSLSTLPQRNAWINPHSSCDIFFYIRSDEIHSILTRFNEFFVPTESGLPPEPSIHKFMKAISSDGLFKCNFHGKNCLSNYLEKYENYSFDTAVRFTVEQSTKEFIPQDCVSSTTSQPNGYGKFLIDALLPRIYTFKAERLNIGKCQAGNQSILNSNASNLAEVLSFLQTSDPYRFNQFTYYVNQIFPHVKQITVPPIGSNLVQIFIWSHDPATKRSDLAVPLSESGTGIGQILAILYVVLMAEESSVIIIDEPQSFLHPGAVRKLFQILKRHPEHQFIITTHSPMAIIDASPSTILLVRREEFESRVEQISVSETQDMRRFLSEVGASLSDVFGSDNILWVEGQTEERCFPILISKFIKDRGLGTKVVGVCHTGDFESKRFPAKTTFEIYERLSNGKGLLPPAVGFIFDPERRTLEQQEELKRQSSGKIFFLGKMMYENYLLNLDALSTIIEQSDSSGATKITQVDVKNWLQSHGSDKKYIGDTKEIDVLSESWINTVHAGKLLKDLFSDLSEKRVNFNKIEHGFLLTNWIIDNSPEDFNELINLIESVLQQS